MHIFQLVRQGFCPFCQFHKGRFIGRGLFKTAMDRIDLFRQTFLPLAAFKGKQGRPQRILNVFGMGTLVDLFFQFLIFLFF